MFRSLRGRLTVLLVLSLAAALAAGALMFLGLLVCIVGPSAALPAVVARQ